MPALSERQLVRRFAERFSAPSDAVRVGIGDDAAVVSALGTNWVASVDASVQGVHFDLRYLTLEEVGHRSFHAALSDLAAMGASPTFALSALTLPRGMLLDDIDQLTRGQERASRQCGCPIVGGNISRGSEITITTTVFGHAERPLRRDGARPGQQIWLIGSVGLAAAGLALLRLGREAQAEESAGLRRCIEAWRSPRALLAEGLGLRDAAGAVIDVSDGLASDLWQLARASQVRMVVEHHELMAALDPASFAASAALRRSALHGALYGGEDYALLATGSAASRPAFARVIGYVARGSGAYLALGGSRCLLGEGYDHLRRSRGRSLAVGG